MTEEHGVSPVFEDDDADYLVLRNAERQYSLWPEYLAVPGGWQVVSGPAARTDCLLHVEQNWRDLRPASLNATGDRTQQNGIHS
ncbi:MbtH family NRPS accessory protein [Streptomyces asoensis]|uniref:MbtH family NRPS accessory protein n=1 Tax=Streptomyces asoensis TaxID=249586 RepID=A0A6M4XBM2_9ACTN|nr:MbtH family NRPS accessory protein [Streptomyces asoensis]QJT05513.1 MbtH family NRPS accessory protein [Streptomyces asoensis]